MRQLLSIGLLCLCGHPLYILAQSNVDKEITAIGDGRGSVLCFWVDTVENNTAILGQRVNSQGQLLWNGGMPVEISAGNTANRQHPVAVSDGSGGSYIVFEMAFTSGNVDVYAQRIDRDGNLKWNQPIAVIASPDQDQAPVATTDGSGGIIVIAEIAPQNGDVDVYAQRIDGNGTLRWNGGDPVPVIESPDVDRVPTAVADGSGGAIVVTEMVFLTGPFAGDVDVYAQRIDGNGILRWNGGDPVPVIESPDVDRIPTAVTDGSGGAIVVTEMAFLTGQFAGDVDVYAQRIDGNGTLRWNGGDPVPVIESPDIDRVPVVIEDGSGGIFVAIEMAFANGDIDIYAQRVDSSGRLRWNSGNPIAIVESLDQDRAPVLVDDGAGGIFVAFETAFVSGTNSGDIDVYAQKVDSNGNLNWNGGNAIPVLASNTTDRDPVIIRDGSGIIILASNEMDVVGQGMDTGGNLLWQSIGAPLIISSPGERASHTSDFDGNGIIGFSDFLLFVQAFGTNQTGPKFDSQFDLDEDGAIGFGDFLRFAQDFGKTVSN